MELAPRCPLTQFYPVKRPPQSDQYEASKGDAPAGPLRREARVAGRRSPCLSTTRTRSAPIQRSAHRSFAIPIGT